MEMKIEYPTEMEMNIINGDGNGGYEIRSKFDSFSSLSLAKQGKTAYSNLFFETSY